MLKIKEFESLTDSEAKSLYEAQALIAILIASADSNIHEDETGWAKKVMGFRQDTGAEALFNYYKIADAHFDEVVKTLLENGKGAQEQIVSLEGELSNLNAALDKVDASFAAELAKSWRSFAKQVAQSAGGFLGFGSISEQEKRLMALDMISK